MAWTLENKLKLYTTILKVCNVKITMAEYKEVAKEMGEGLTANAIEIQVRKLRKEAAASGDVNGASNGGAKEAAKNGKHGGAKGSAGDEETPTKKKPRAPRKRSAKDLAELKTPEDMEEEGPESPLKKLKLKVEDNYEENNELEV